MEHPNLQPPAFRNLPTGPVLWTVQLPLGYELHHGSEPVGRPVHAGPAYVSLNLAAAQLERCRHLAQQLRTAAKKPALLEIEAAQRVFYWHTRQAEHGLKSSTDSGPVGLALNDWLGKLRQQNAALAREFDFENTRAAAEKHPQRPEPKRTDHSWILSAGGLPTYWLATEHDLAPTLVLTRTASERWWSALIATELLVMVLLLVLFVSLFPSLVRWCRITIPEQILLIAWLGWLGFGHSLVGVFLILVAIGARVLLLTAWLRARYQPRGQDTDVSVGSSVVI